MADFIPSTAREQREMLTVLELRSMEDLFSEIPSEVRLQHALDLPPALSEMEIVQQARKMASQNKNLDDDYCCFLGAGAFDHYIPAAVDQLAGRQEFYTAYTPYQPEISQGTLQAIFEYQSMICELTGMDLANASLYCGASALAEAALMAVQKTRRKRLLVAPGFHPDSLAVLKTYARFQELIVDVLPFDPKKGAIAQESWQEQLSEDTAAVLIQYPNFFGVIESLEMFAKPIHQNQSLLVVSADPIALGIFKAPGDLGADIVVGDGQALGNGLHFGGPSLGFLAARESFMRRIPGRIVGETIDEKKERRFVLTIQTREQHIRREKATSNICTNQSLNALKAAIYLALTGPEGLARVAELCVRKSHDLYQRLLKLEGFSPAYTGPFFKSFTLRFDGDLEGLNCFLLDKGFLGGLDLGQVNPDWAHIWLLAVTEKRTESEINHFIQAVSQFIDESGVSV